MVLVERLNAGTATSYSDGTCLGNLEINLKLEETCAESEESCGIYGIFHSYRHPSWNASA
jgi:hypothetical protein